jgi:hypothetical protein
MEFVNFNKGVSKKKKPFTVSPKRPKLENHFHSNSYFCIGVPKEPRRRAAMEGRGRRLAALLLGGSVLAMLVVGSLHMRVRRPVA